MSSFHKGEKWAQRLYNRPFAQREWKSLCCLLSIAASPINGCGRLILNMIRADKHLDDGTRDRFLRRFKEEFGFDAMSADSSTFWLPSIFIESKSRQTARKDSYALPPSVWLFTEYERVLSYAIDCYYSTESICW